MPIVMFGILITNSEDWQRRRRKQVRNDLGQHDDQDDHCELDFNFYATFRRQCVEKQEYARENRIELEVERAPSNVYLIHDERILFGTKLVENWLWIGANVCQLLLAVLNLLVVLTVVTHVNQKDRFVVLRQVAELEVVDLCAKRKLLHLDWTIHLIAFLLRKLNQKKREDSFLRLEYLKIKNVTKVIRFDTILICDQFPVFN